MCCQVHTDSSGQSAESCLLATQTRLHDTDPKATQTMITVLSVLDGVEDIVAEAALEK